MMRMPLSLLHPRPDLQGAENERAEQNDGLGYVVMVKD